MFSAPSLYIRFHCKALLQGKDLTLSHSIAPHAASLPRSSCSDLQKCFGLYHWLEVALHGACNMKVQEGFKDLTNMAFARNRFWAHTPGLFSDLIKPRVRHVLLQVSVHAKSTTTATNITVSHKPHGNARYCIIRGR